MNAGLNKLFKFIEMLMALMFGGMIALVLFNVILRYFFNSGITWSEELARFLFFWLIFLGAIGAMRDNSHLGVDTVIKRLSPRAQKLAYIVGQILMLITMIILVKGSFDLTMINLGSKASATNLPLSFIYGTGIVTGICISINILANLYKALFVEGSMEGLIQLQESEEDLLINRQDQGGEQ
jgi:TRAP-type C4-dicarboxylate transport system permease small subunit